MRWDWEHGSHGKGQTHHHTGFNEKEVYWGKERRGERERKGGREEDSDLPPQRE